ncbi:cell surface glycoprotein 1-like [Boleophthalmus pectinirostris]|uniref:cell surface glycoprotein 1-like n=1 Tax=Boleophthalmus pectinirostris TaxID=150288 RepID=UPI00243253FC|nr:cell surface glycoprotein 1-like [Boleophthalmus pectinirostris]
MDPMTQSAQISSSQGFADGHNSAAKDSKISDSFLSSSPVSLIQSPQDKRVLGSDSELHFTQSTSSSHGNFSSQSEDQPDSPIKTSPVSERIKALEALAAKKKEPDFRSDGYSHYRDRHTDKRSSIEIQKAAFEKNEKTTTAPKKGSSSDKESPDSPFEVLGDCKQLKELEETEEWMKAHLPPVPDFHSDDITKSPAVSESIYSTHEKENVTPGGSASFAGVPDSFMDSPLKGENLEAVPVPQNPYAEEECDFDLSFLPTAYMWNQQEKNDDAVVPMSPDTLVGSAPVSSPEHIEKNQMTCDPDPPETVEVDSSGESDDTVIEDGVPVHAPASSEFEKPICSNLPKDDKETPPAKSERKLMQVPTINVIETDEPNYSDEEMELELEEVEEQNVEKAQDINKPCPDDIISESQFTEGYSPPSSPVESDTDNSPEHREQEPSHEAALQGPQRSQPADDFKVQSRDFGNLPNNDPEDFSDHDDEWGDQTMDVSNPVNATSDPASTKPKTDETITEITDTPLEAHKPQTSFLHDEIYDRESFDYDYDAPPSPTDDGDDSEPDVAIDQPYTNPFHVNAEKNSTQSNARDTFNSQNDNTFITQDTVSKKYPQDPYSIFYTAPKSTSEPDVDNVTQNINLDDNCNKIKDQNSETQHAEKDLILVTKEAPDCSDVSSTEPADSFVQFMRECLKSKQDEETQGEDDTTSSKMDKPISQSVVMDLEQEKLTISALKELGGSQEEEEVEPTLQSAKPNTVEPSLASTQHNTQSPCPSNTQTPCSPSSNPAHDSTYAREVEAIDEWVAEAYHLAEHVLTAVLTHLSGNLFFPNFS